ncbi:hypothetical protein SAMN05414139_10275 [Burkholderia sp. D7]|nr:hypothetical protein SAMN05414139_10275 [Burkholderia sp. D7]
MSDITDESTVPEPGEIRRGFYVVASKSNNRIWLADSLRGAAATLDQVIATNLDVDDAWWIDYCLGPDSQGRMAWMGTDKSEIIFELQTVLRLLDKK